MSADQPDDLPSSPPTPDQDEAAEPYRVDLTRGGLARGLLHLVWPIMLASLLQTLVGFADLMMVGRLPEATEAIAAVGMSWKILFVVMVVVFAVSTGAQVLVSRSVGAGDIRTAERATGQAFLILGVLVGVVLSPLGAFLAPELLRITKAPPGVLEAGSPYLRIMFLAGPAMLTSFLFSSCLQGAGDSRSPLILTAFVNLANICLNYLLIFGNLGFPQLGVLGAALGTFTARWLGAGAALVLLSSGRLALTVNWAEDLRPNLMLWWRMLRIGIPSGLQGLVRAVSGWLVVFILGSLPEAKALIAAHTVAEQFLMLTAFIGFAAMPAGMTVVGQNMGAGQPDRAEAGGWAVVKLATGLMLIPATIYLVAAPYWVRLVGHEASVATIAYGAVALRLLTLGEPCWAVNMSLAGALRGGGDTLSPLIFTVLTQLCMGIGSGALIVFLTDVGAVGLWGAIVVSMYAQSALTIWWFRRGRWKSLTV